MQTDDTLILANDIFATKEEKAIKEANINQINLDTSEWVEREFRKGAGNEG